MSDHARVQPSLTIGTLDEIVQRYPVHSSVQDQRIFRTFGAELDERTTDFIARQLHLIRIAL
jgi:hypothetical protein